MPRSSFGLVRLGRSSVHRIVYVAAHLLVLERKQVRLAVDQKDLERVVAQQKAPLQ